MHRGLRHFKDIKDRERRRIVDLSKDLGTTVGVAEAFYQKEWRQLPSVFEIMADARGVYAFSQAYEKKSEIVYHVVRAGLQ